MIKIANIYDDLLNLYGDTGNAKALAYHLRETGEEVLLDKIKFGDEINFSEYNIIFIGSGTENNLKLALDDILQYKNDIIEYKSKGGFLVATGNSIELFGKSALEIFDYTVTFPDERTVKDVCIKTPLFDTDIIGFENHRGTIDRDEKIILDGNFILTYTIGPLLVRNPKLTDYIIKKLLSSINSSCNPEKADYTFEEKAYETSQKTDLKNISST